MKGPALLGAIAVGVALLPPLLFVILSLTFTYDSSDEYAGLSVIAVPILAGLLCGPFAVLGGGAAVIISRRRPELGRLPIVLGGIAIVIGLAEVLALLIVA